MDNDEQVKELVTEVKEEMGMSGRIIEMLKNGVSQREIARRLNKSQATISYWVEKLKKLQPGEFEVRKPGRPKDEPSEFAEDESGERESAEVPFKPFNWEARFRREQKTIEYWLEEEAKVKAMEKILGPYYWLEESEREQRHFEEYKDKVRELIRRGIPEQEAKDTIKKEMSIGQRLSPEIINKELK